MVTLYLSFLFGIFEIFSLYPCWFTSTTICLNMGIILFILLSLKVNFVLKTQVFLQLWKNFISMSLNIASSTTIFFSHGTCITPVYFSICLHYNCSLIVSISIYVLYSRWVIQDCYPIHKFSIQMCHFILSIENLSYHFLNSKFSIWFLLYLPTLILLSLLCFIIFCLLY